MGWFVYSHEERIQAAELYMTLGKRFGPHHSAIGLSDQERPAGRGQLGMVAFGMNDVAKLTDAQIRPTPAMGMNEGAHNLVAEVATIGERNLLLTDVGALMNARGSAMLDVATC